MSIETNSNINSPVSSIQICIVILTVIALGTVLYFMRSVFIPLTFALLLSFITVPSSLFLQNKMRIPRGIGNIIVLGIMGGFLYVSTRFAIQSSQLIFNNLNYYNLKLLEILDDIIIRYHLPEDFLNNSFLSQDVLDSIYPFLSQTVSQTVGFFTQVMLILLFMTFILMDDPLHFLKLKRSFSFRSAINIMKTFRNISKQVNRYLITKLIISILTGLGYYMVLSIADLNLAHIWAGLAFILNFIPTFGSIIVTIIIALVALVQFYPDITTFLSVISALLVIQLILGNLLEPSLQGARLKLSPVFILISLAIWGWLWGPIGMILSVPLIETIKITCKNINYLRPVSILLEQVNPPPFYSLIKRIGTKNNL